MVDFIPYQDVVLLRDIPEEGLCAGDVGTMVDRHGVPGRETGYSVEFFDMLLASHIRHRNFDNRLCPKLCPSASEPLLADRQG